MYLESTENLFGDILGADILDINVIAGENGVGKSTILRAIAEIMGDYEDFQYYPEYSAIIVYQVDFETIVVANSLDWVIQIPIDKGPGMDNYLIDYHIAKNEFKRSLIYFSPYLDFNLLDVPTNEDNPTVIDISLTSVIAEDLDNETGDVAELENSIFYHKFKNSQRQINFVNKHQDNFDLPFGIPEKIDIKFSRLHPKKDDISTWDNILFERFQALCASHFRAYPKSGASKEAIAKLLFLRNLLTMYFLAVNDDHTSEILHHKAPNNLSEIIDALQDETPEQLIAYLLAFFLEEDVFKISVFKDLTDLAFSLIDDKDNELIFLNGNHHLSINIAEGTTSAQLLQLFSILENPFKSNFHIKGISNSIYKFVSFEWENISSGEKMFLDLFSRLSTVFSKLRHKDQAIIVMLDEGEAGFHPSWQIKYISYLRIFFNKLFSGHKVQLILASHSPLVLSDFPKDRVHLFKKGNNGLREKQQSFGTLAQNVSDLLANEFFIDTALVGDLAREFINDILLRINKPFSEDDNDEILRRIAIVDEPLIKKLLLNELERVTNA